MSKSGKKDYSALRKKWQKAGEAPDWFTTAGVQLFCEKYSWKGETIKARWQTIAKMLASHCPKSYPSWWSVDPYASGKSYEEVFFNVMWDGFVSPSTPLLANGGIRKRGTTVSCAGSYMGNNLYDRYNVVTEAAILTKQSHGTSLSVDPWPHEGAPLKRGGYSLGVMPVIRDLINTMDEVVQGSRRGSLAYSIRPQHGDFSKVVEYLYERQESNNVGWLIDDEFVGMLHDEDPIALSKLGDMLATKLPRGKGYFTFIDKMNRHLAEAFKRKGLTAKASNLCVAPETQILTKFGHVPIAELEGCSVDVWNGEEWSNVDVVKTGENQELLLVEMVSGKSLHCTPYHKFYVEEGGQQVEKRASDLVDGDSLIPYKSPSGVVVQEVVANVTLVGRFDDTYCFSEPKRHMGVFNGILTGQCQETNLPADENYTFSCVIINANLEHYRSFPDNLFKILHLMQDCNVSEYLETMDTTLSHQDRKAMEKIYNFTKDFRAVGSGVLGWHTLLQKEMIVVGSMESFILNDEIFRKMDEQTLECSQWLAEELGEPEGCEGLGIRNATRMMMPPTKSTAEIMAGASEGIGYDVAMVYTKLTAGGEVFRINKVLLDIMKERGVYNDGTLKHITDHKGSVQKVDWLSDAEKAVFRTAFEIPMEAHLDLCAQRQQHIDQQQSINLYFTSNDSQEYISNIHRKAFEDENILSLYYVYSMRGAGDIQRVSECESCQ